VTFGPSVREYKPSLTGQEGVVDNREFLGNSGTT